LQLPIEASRPILLRFDPSTEPVMRLAFVDTDEFARASPAESGSVERLKSLRRFADDRLKPDLESVDGSAAVKVSGGYEDEIQVFVDQGKLAQLNLSIETIAQRLREENVNLSGGRLEQGTQRFLVRTLNEFTTVQEMADSIVANVGDRPVYLRDVAIVTSGFKDREAITRLDGRESIELAIYKEGDANTVQLAGGLRTRVEALGESLPGGSEIRLVYDHPDLVQDPHGELTPAAAAAFGLAAGTPVILGRVEVIALPVAAGLATNARVGCTILDGGGIHIRTHGEASKLERRLLAIDAIMPYAATWFAVAQGPATVSASWLVELATQLLADAGLIGISRDELVAILEHHATAAAPGAVLFAPGSPAAEQASPDLPAGFTGISGATTFYDLLRSLHEGQALAARAGYGALGGSPAEVRMAGDGAASRLARQVLAAHVDAPVRMVRRERPAAAGAALIATIALAHYPTLADATRDWVEPHLGDLEPVDPDLRAVYARRFPATPAASRGRVA
jgi:hypothetical protein